MERVEGSVPFCFGRGGELIGRMIIVCRLLADLILNCHSFVNGLKLLQTTVTYRSGKNSEKLF